MQTRTKADAYADTLTAIFSLAAVNHGHSATAVAEFHRLMASLRKEFPADLPSFDNEDKPDCGYSSLLADALHRARFSQPARIRSEGAWLVVDRETAARNLNVFDPFSRQRFVRRFTRVAARFVALQRDGTVEPPDVA